MNISNSKQTDLLDYLSNQCSEKDCDPKSNNVLKKVWEDTLLCFSKKGPYKKYKPLQSEVIWSLKLNPLPVYDDTFVTVQNMKSLELAKVLVEADYNPLVLNMASNFRPGGGVRKGSRAQEEDLFRKTNYFRTLDERYLPKKTYPLKGTNMIYSPRVSVIKDNNYDYLAKPFVVDFLACPALRNPKTINGGTEFKHEADYYLMEQRIELIYKIGCAKGHDSLILGALGCGAFHNPVQSVAQIFKRMNEKYHGCFRLIAFPVFSGSANANYDIFKGILEPDDPGNTDENLT